MSCHKGGTESALMARRRRREQRMVEGWKDGKISKEYK
jgi:hypothetical protein